MKSPIPGILDFSWRVLVVAVGYTVALMAGGVVLGMAGLLSADAGANVDATEMMFWTFVGGLILGLVLGLVAQRVPASAGRHLLIWGTLLMANIGAVIIEGYFFVPDLVTNLWASLAQQLLPCLVTAALVYWLFAPRPAQDPALVLHRPWYQWLWRFLVSAGAYLAAYWVFGAINFELVTRRYYEAAGTPLAVPDPMITLQAELIRSVLIVLSILPFLLTAQFPIRRLAMLSGLLLFVVGGVVPLTWQASTLATPLLLASAVEIFLQNFTTGVVATFLLVGPGVRSIEPQLHAA